MGGKAPPQGSSAIAEDSSVAAENEALARERDALKAKHEKLEGEAGRLDGVIAEMQRTIYDFTRFASKLPAARFRRPLKRSELLLVPELAEEETRKITWRLDQLKDRLTFLTRKHNDLLAENERLRARVDEARRLKMHQTSSISEASSANERTSHTISSKIVAAQRAYAERAIYDGHVLDMQTHSAEAAAEHATALARLATEERALDKAAAARASELVELQASMHAAIAGARAEDERSRKAQAEYAAIVEQRERAEGELQQVAATLGLQSTLELTAAYESTASTIVTLWELQTQQEAEVERRAAELRALSEERGVMEARRLQLRGGAAAPAAADEPAADAPTAEAHAHGAASAQPAAAEQRLLARLLQKEATSTQVCAMVEQFARSLPQARERLVASGEAAEPRCGARNVIRFLAAVEEVVTERLLALRREAARAELAAAEAAWQEERRLRELEQAASDPSGLGALGALGGSSSPASGPPFSPFASYVSGSEGVGALRNSRKAREARAAREVRIVPPSMEGVVTREVGDEVVAVMGYGEMRFGRKSLRSELLTQILGGVEAQRDKLRHTLLARLPAAERPAALSKGELERSARERARRQQNHASYRSTELEKAERRASSAAKAPAGQAAAAAPTGSSAPHLPASPAKRGPSLLAPLGTETITRGTHAALACATSPSALFCSAARCPAARARPLCVPEPMAPACGSPF